MSNDTTRKVTWVDPDGGDRKPGVIRNYNPENEIHFVNLDDGGEAEALIYELEFAYVPIGPETINVRHVIWTNRRRDTRHRGFIIECDPAPELLYVHLDEGGYAHAPLSDLEFPTERKVIWTDPQGGARKRGTIPTYDATEDIHLVKLEDGGEAYAMTLNLEFPGELSPIDMERIATALDGGTNMLSAELKAENRARIFTAIETCTHEDWVEARGSYVHGSETLWQAVLRVHNTCRNAGDTPGREQMITALETKPEA